MTKVVKEFLLDNATGDVSVEYDDNSTSKYNLANAVTATQSAQGIVLPGSLSIDARRPVVIDTDWWTDVDDVVAMRVARWAEQSGYIDIIGVTINAAYKDSAESLDAYFVGDGRPGMTIGIDTAATDYTGSPPYQAAMIQNRHAEGAPAQALSAVRVLRAALAYSTAKVDVIGIGYMNNLAALLASPPDDISDLSGLDLVTRKAGRLYQMAGRWPVGSENNITRNPRSIAAAVSVATNWPGEIIFVGYNVANDIATGDNLAGAESTDMCAKALEDYGVAGVGRASWDPITVWIAALANFEATKMSLVRGRPVVDPSTGANSWIYEPQGQHAFVVRRDTAENYKAALNALLIKASWQARKPVAPVAVPRTPSVALAATLIEGWRGSDLAHRADGETIYHVPGIRRDSAMRSASGERPTVTTVGGKKCLDFTSTGKRLTSDILAVPAEITVYARVRWGTVPIAAQTAIAADYGSSSGDRLFHVKAVSSTQIQVARFSGTTGFTDIGTGTIAANTWVDLVFVGTSTDFEATLGGTAGARTAIASPNAVPSIFSLGARNWTGAISEGFTGYIAEARVYAGAHTPEQVAVVIADLS